jgi:hypothetical protein
MTILLACECEGRCLHYCWFVLFSCFVVCYWVCSQLKVGPGSEVDVSAREAAARSLAALTHREPRAVAAVGVAGAVGLLLGSLDAAAGATPELQEAAARCVWNLCHDREVAGAVGREVRWQTENKYT